ncbi:F-box protein SKIP19-like [Tripterygium wilfordii]|uniref:F-box protein SKIP19-like n=1 Tax=Tripterygium wilfordii TaxID=458696 RepID=A0A7J7E2F1_TRIWF|nr:F-box protein SKIP19-like [Tripterygium wilfordii]KAF5752711.1 F-box protein SKIP19-like [Tripterygium wilfordii]
MEGDLKPNLSDESQYRNWLALPNEITSTILQRLGAVGILKSAQYVCVAWRNISKDPSMWRSIDMRDHGDFWNMDFRLEKMCFLAIDRSCGNLVDISIQDFGSDELLKHIANSASGLKRLQLVSCLGMTDDGLSELAAKVPMLEELDLSHCSFSGRAVEAVGRCCPLLKSLKLNCSWINCGHVECEKGARSIAGNMPGLHHLQIFGNKLTNIDLLAILDGCPHLESLDLRRCFNVEMAGSVAKRCAEQIKDLRSPYDSVYDYPFDIEIFDIDSFDEDYPAGFSEIDIVSDDDGHYEFSEGNDFSYYGDMDGVAFDYPSDLELPDVGSSDEDSPSEFSVD